MLGGSSETLHLMPRPVINSRPGSTPLRVAIDARLSSGEDGGVESVTIGLVKGLSTLQDSDDEYLVLANSGEDEWIAEYASGPTRVIRLATPVRRRIKHRLAIAAPWLASPWRARPFRQSPAGPPRSDGTIERLNVDIMHFVNQRGFLTAIPTIYHPHDLQHLHFPEFFSHDQRQQRELWYRTLCEQAAMVAVASSWTKRDIQGQYGLAAEKVCVVPLAPPTESYAHPSSDELEETKLRLDLPDTYAFYPAQTWPHKNHLGLIDALARLRDERRVTIPLVFSGRQNEHFAAVKLRVEQLGMGAQFRWLGFVSTRDMQVLYSKARAVLIPSLFEAASAPLWEAFLAGVPVACSNVTALPEQAGDAALIFDPRDSDMMVEAIYKVLVDDGVRERLIVAGRRRVATYTWHRTARLFRAHYRRIAGRVSTSEDEQLLSAAPGL